MDNASEDTAEVSSRVYLPKLADRQAQTGTVSGPYKGGMYGVYANDPAQSIVLKPRKMETRNGGSHWLRSTDRAGNQPDAPVVRIAQEANAAGKAGGYADVGTGDEKIKAQAEDRSYDR